MYQKDDLIVHQSAGVCRVTDTTMMAFSKGSEKQLYYVLQPLREGGVLYSPVDSDKVFLRPALTREQALALIDTIPTIDAQAFHTRSLQELADHYQQALGTHDCADLVELILSIWAKKQDVEENRRRLGQLDLRYMKQAEELLYGELACALEIPDEQVQSFIADRLDNVAFGAPTAQPLI